MKTRIIFAAAALFAVAAVWSAAPVFAQRGGGDDGGGIGGGDDGGSGGDDGGSGGDDGGGGSGGGGSGIGSGSGNGSGGGSGDDSGGGLGTDGGFSRQQREPGDFVGADSGDNLSVRGGLDEDAGAGSGQGLGGFFNQLFGQGGLGGTQQQRQRNQPATGRVRVRLTPSIEYFGGGEMNSHGARLAARQATILPRYSNNPHLGSIAGVQMVVEDRVAVVTGTVATERQKELIGGMLELEPGISSVDNRLIVAPGASLPAASSRDSVSTRAFSAATD